MSCRWKKKQNRNKKKKNDSRKKLPQGWMTMEDFSRLPGKMQKNPIHSTSCPRTGKTYVKLFMSRYLDSTEEELLERMTGLLETISQMGGEMSFGEGMPLWQRCEYLENVIEFENDRFCGCQD